MISFFIGVFTGAALTFVSFFVAMRHDWAERRKIDGRLRYLEKICAAAKDFSVATVAGIVLGITNSRAAMPRMTEQCLRNPCRACLRTNSTLTPGR